MKVGELKDMMQDNNKAEETTFIQQSPLCFTIGENGIE